MPRYDYIVKTKDSKTLKGTQDATSKDELIARLRARGFFIVSIKEQKPSTRAAGAKLFSQSKGKRASVKVYDLAFFARNLATTLSSGVTLLRSLEIIAHQTESSGLAKVLQNCCNDIKSGLSFGEAVEKYPKVFSNLWSGIVRVGETSGNLPFVLERLADFLEMRMEFERRIKSALIYPGILMGAAAIAIFVFLKFIFPKFSDLFKQFDIELPWATQAIFAISNFLEDNFGIILLAILGLIVAFFILKKNPEVKRFWHKTSLKLPLIGEMIFLSALERLTSTIHILLESGLPLVYTLEVSARSVGNIILEEKLLAVGQKVRGGSSLSEEFSKEGIFPMLVSEMSKIGEETGSMPEVFKKISLHYRKDLTTKIERFITAFEPLMIIFMGIVIGGIVVSLFLPLFKIATLSQ